MRLPAHSCEHCGEICRAFLSRDLVEGLIHGFYGWEPDALRRIRDAAAEVLARLRPWA